jgi:hypothetical protein
MYGTYLRLNVPVWATNREVIKAARGKIQKKCRRAAKYREGRKLYYRSMLDYHAKARALFREYRF